MNLSNYYHAIKSRSIKFVLIGTALSLQSCIPLLLIKHHAKPSLEHDEIKGISRYKSTLYYRLSEEKNSGFIYNEQQIFKEVSAMRKKYKVYDYIKLNHRLNEIEKTIYYVVDGKASPINIQLQKNESRSEIEKNEEDIILADSSKTTVIKDYEIQYYTFMSIEYTITEELVNAIAQADEVKIRYYTPPEMITLNLSKHKRKTFLELANSEFDFKTNNSNQLIIKN